jgi:hypothetical protein
MAYDYEVERLRLFTADGVKHMTAVRDQVKELLSQAGAFRGDAIHTAGNSWLTLAAIDWLVECKEIVPLRDKNKCWGQYQVYSTPQVHNL